MQRTFGRWQVQPLDTSSGLDGGRSSVLVEALAGPPRAAQSTRPPQLSGRAHPPSQRPRHRRRDQRLETARPPQSSRPATRGRPSMTCSRSARLDGPDAGCAACSPAAAPTITHQEVPAPTALLRETVALSEAGVPTVNYLRQVADNGLRTTHDFNTALPRPSYGVAWSGFSSWPRRPSVTTDIPGLYTASPVIPGRLRGIPCRALRGARRLRLPRATSGPRSDRGNFGDPDNFRILRCLFFRVRIILLDTRAERNEFRQRARRISSC